MYQAAWIAIVLEIILLLIWIYSIFFQVNGTDPAGRGMAMGFVLALAAYIGASIFLLMLQRNWSVALALLMAGIPLVIVVVGLVKKYG